MEIRPGIHLIPGLRWSNAFLLVEQHQLTLIDAGVPGDGKKIRSYIHDIGRDLLELKQAVLTHSHPDHTGPLKGLAQSTGATIMVHALDTRLRARTSSRWLHYPAQPPAFSWNVPFLHRIPAHKLVEDGETLPVLGGLQVIHTPGHTSGSVCLLLPQAGVLFTGDTLLADGHSFRRPVPFPGTNFRDYRASLDRLAQVPFETACVGHGKPLFQGGSVKLQDMLEHYCWLTPRWNWLKRRTRTLISH